MFSLKTGGLACDYSRYIDLVWCDGRGHRVGTILSVLQREVSSVRI